MTILSESVLIESKSARDLQLSGISAERAHQILERAKAIIFAFWQGVGIATTQQMAEYYEVSVEAVQKIAQRQKAELEADGLKSLKGKDLRDVVDKLSISSRTPNLTVWNPRAALRLAMLLTESKVAAQVRTIMLDLVAQVPVQAQENSQELEIKKLELELMNAKKSYLETSQAILASTSPAMLAFLRGDGPLPTKIEYRDRYVDPSTRQEVGSSEGRSLTQLLTDAGLNPKSTSDRTKVKNILKSHGLDYDIKQNWGTASYLREYAVLPDEVYQQALRIVVEELAAGSQPNLFVHQFQQTCLPSEKEKPKLSN